MNTASLFYIAFSSLVVLMGARIVAVSEYCHRLPRPMEVLRTPPLLKGSRALRMVKIFVLCWLGIFIFAWLRDIKLASDEQRLIRGFFAITAFNFAVLLNALLSAKFNIYFRGEGDSISEQNSLYFKTTNVFPGFARPLDTLITLCSVMMVLAITLAMAAPLVSIG